MKIGIVGSGAMGSGIAQVMASAGHSVKIYDVNDIALEKSLAKIRIGLKKMAEKGKMSLIEAGAISGRIQAAERLESLGDSDVIIEAIVEDLAIKKSIFSELELYVDADCLLTSNTSSLSITAIASACQNPERVIGIHFFNPAPTMPLVEIIPALQTPQYQVQKVTEWIENIGKTVVIAKDTPGFIVNRIARPFYSEAIRIYEEGIADFKEIDATMVAYGFRMGPFTLMDLIGHDVNYAVTESVWQNTYFDARYRPSVTQKRLVEAGYLGQKSLRGFYDYTTLNTDNQIVVSEEKQNLIFDRIITMLINEAYEALYYQIGSREDIETAMRKGVNYPKGLLSWGEEIGLKKIVARMDSLFDTYHEERYRCSALLRQKI